MDPDILETRRTCAKSIAPWIPALLSLPLWLAACAMDTVNEPATATQGQALGAGCTLLRPYGWASGSQSCFEPSYINTPLSMADGDTYGAATVTSPPVGAGVGSATVGCSNGTLIVLAADCTRVNGPPD